MAEVLADWVAYLEAGNFLTLADESRHRCAGRQWRPLAALPDTTPFVAVTTAITCAADFPPDILVAHLQAAHRGIFWTVLAGAVATAPRLEDLHAIESAVKDQGAYRRCPLGHPARLGGRGSTPQDPSASLSSASLGASSGGGTACGGGSPGSSATNVTTSTPPILHPAPRHVHYALADIPGPGPMVCAVPRTTPAAAAWAHTTPSPAATGPWQAAYPTPAPVPDARVGSPASSPPFNHRGLRPRPRDHDISRGHGRPAGLLGGHQVPPIPQSPTQLRLRSLL